jgi:hypothetical protein
VLTLIDFELSPNPALSAEEARLFDYLNLVEMALARYAGRRAPRRAGAPGAAVRDERARAAARPAGRAAGAQSCRACWPTATFRARWRGISLCNNPERAA